MRLEYVDGVCKNGPCPGLYVSDRDTLVIVGALVDHRGIGDLDGRVAAHERAVEVPRQLIEWIAKVRSREE